jgi:hypothetical protein
MSTQTKKWVYLQDLVSIALAVCLAVFYTFA